MGHAVLKQDCDRGKNRMGRETCPSYVIAINCIIFIIGIFFSRDATSINIELILVSEDI
jgi:hypothetical protein